MLIRTSHLESAASYNFINDYLFPLRRSQDAPKTLDVLTRTMAIADCYGNVSGRKVNALVQNVYAYKDSHLAFAETLQPLCPLSGLNITGDRRNWTLTSHVKCGVIIGYKHEDE